MIDGERVLLHALAGILRITVVADNGDAVAYSKQMTPRAMRILAINLFQAAEEQESNIGFMKK